MKPLFHLLILWITVSGLSLPVNPAAAQNAPPSYLISHEWLADFPGLFGGENVKVFKIVYNTVDPFGEPTIASGAFAVPRNWDCDFPLVSYQHGTILNKADVPSNMGSEGIFAAIAFAMDGYACAAPDYLGLGESPGLHPFMHAKTHASSVIDMLRACREFAAQQGIRFNDQLFLIGYSQGGHSTMAAHRAMQQEFPDEFPVTAAAPGSGPYDVSGIQTDVIISDDPYPAPGYMPYVILSYQMIYGNLYEDISDVFKPPYDEIIPPYYGANFDMADVDEAMPDVPKTIIYDSFFLPFVNDPEHPMRIALRDNDVTDWIPEVPVRMYYCEADRHVPHGNSLVAEDVFRQNGAADVTAVHLALGDVFSHEPCFGLALLEGKRFIDGFRDPCSLVTSVSGNVRVEQLDIYPNPALNAVRINFPNPVNSKVELTVHDLTGRTVRQMRITENTILLPRNALNSGIYIAEIRSEAQRFIGKIVFE